MIVDEGRALNVDFNLNKRAERLPSLLDPTRPLHNATALVVFISLILTVFAASFARNLDAARGLAEIEKTHPELARLGYALPGEKLSLEDDIEFITHQAQPRARNTRALSL